MIQSNSMVEGKLTVGGRRDWWFGVLVPHPFFFQMRGTFGLYAEPEELPIGLGVPIGFLVAVFLLLPDLPAMAKRLQLGFLPKAGIVLFSTWVLFLGMLGAQLDLLALLYAVQWIAPVILVFYLAVVVQSEQRLEQLLSGLRRGTGLALIWLCGLFLMELFASGGFEGRMTQNAYLPGMYQLYNYVPVSLTLASLFCAGVEALSRHKKRQWKTWAFLFGAAMVPLMTGARDPALIYLVVAPFAAWWTARLRGLIYLVGGSATMVLFFLLLVDGNLLLLHKLHGTFASYGETTLRGMFGPRADVMESYWGLVERHPWTGLRLLPPSIADPEAGVIAKSAHNTYIDIAARGGPLALVSFCMIVFSALWHVPRLLIRSVREANETLRAPSMLRVAAQAAAAPVAGLLLISCNLRTPLREPISAAIGFLLIGFILCWAYAEKRGSASSSSIKG
ncbi:MAG: O-antigen ligase family protein [Arenicella sp.]|nr:O-antigen ligase family protein [Arenicella sp.]